MSTNYANSYLRGACKVYSYSLSGWRAIGDKKPYVYITLLTIFLLSLILNIKLLTVIFTLSYILLRTIIIPFVKANYNYRILNPINLPGLFITGLTIDASRIFAYIANISIN